VESNNEGSIHESNGSSGGDAGQILRQITDDIWAHWLERDVEIRLLEGLNAVDLPPVSYEQAQEEAMFNRSILERLNRIQPEALAYADQLTLKTLQWDFDILVAQAQHFWLMSPVTPYSSPLNGAHRAFASFAFEKDADLQEYVNLLQKYPTMVDATRERVSRQREQGILLPREELSLVIPFLQSVTRDPAHSIFQVAEDRLEPVKQAGTEVFRDHVARIISTEINPALQRLADTFSDDYVSAAPEDVGLSQYQGGEDFYRLLIRYHTTLPLPPDEVHAMGLEAVAALETQMDDLRQTLGFEGSRAEFQQFLRNDPRFFAKTPEEVGERLMGHIRAIEPEIDAFFSHLPKAPYGVKRLEPHLEGAMTFGYYDLPKPSEPVGYYKYNGSNLDQRSLYNAAGLIYHELIPGHHFQVALQMENQSLPKVRRLPSHSAYVEGWAEYAAELAKKMGMYQDPYDLYGRLMMDMFLAVRLVVDTGMNYYRWPRERAEAYMRDHVLESDRQIYTETLRYSVDLPGQALAYKIGSLKMKELRERAEKALSAGFDIRRYHDMILRHGSIPLSLLEWHVGNFIQWEKSL
jgi:uncharacterized protein (DUF885 family)